MNQANRTKLFAMNHSLDHPLSPPLPPVTADTICLISCHRILPSTRLPVTLMTQLAEKQMTHPPLAVILSIIIIRLSYLLRRIHLLLPSLHHHLSRSQLSQNINSISLAPLLEHLTSFVIIFLPPPLTMKCFLSALLEGYSLETSKILAHRISLQPLIEN